ncbi:MAG TPA: SPFH domain-containing protein [bacterium]|nr:SPFH domain-containing protein [bacterium]HPS29876.1 SPFH domain-containing protein [bacterium]
MAEVSGFSLFAVILVAVLVLALFGTFLGLMRRYKRCPADKVLVVYGKIGAGHSSRCIHGGAAFIWPLFQDYQFLDLIPMSIEVNLRNALSKQNIRVDVPSRFTIGISTEMEVMQNAAERLLGLSQKQITDIASDILFGQLRLVIATMNIEEINSDRDKFLLNVSKNVEAELSKIGLKLINVNVTDIKDESGYIEALGKEAAAQAINDAKKSVAEKDRDGAIGEANAKQDERVQVANALALAKIGEAEAHRSERIKISEAESLAQSGEADWQRAQRISIASANSKAVQGENTAKIEIANSDATRREKEAEALRKATAAEKVATAKALEESYQAEKDAETARAKREQATREADVIIPAEIGKRRIEIDAEAEAEKTRRLARGQADAIFAKMEAEGRGIYEILSKQADGFKQIVGAAGGDSKSAFLLMMADKMPELVKMQVEAIKNIKIDKVTVWDSGNGAGGDKTSTANFMSGLAKTIPPLNDLFNLAGMKLPEYLGQEKEKAKDPE